MRLTLATGAVALAVSLALTGCTSGSSSTASNSTASASATPTPTAPPAFKPDGTAQENATYLGYVVGQTQAKDPKLDADEVAEAVGSAGFTRRGIQYTFAATAVGLNSDSVYIAVPWGEQCLIAQYGPVITGVHTVVLPILKQGGCLVGPTIQTLR